MSDSICVIFEDGKMSHLEVSLPMRVLYHGKTYLLAVSNGHRQGLILTRDPDMTHPVEQNTEGVDGTTRSV